MINNKQVNIWRGDNAPPTIYHVWIYNNEKILLFNGTEWVTFIDDLETTQKINELQNQVGIINNEISDLKSNTVNNKLIVDNPILDGTDLVLKESGSFTNENKTLTENINILDKLFETLIIE